MLTLVTLIVILGFLLLVSFVGNAGHVVVQKMEVQNAADAAAYSSALWMARGMNAVTTTNHLMGEITALVVILDSLGGSAIGKEAAANDDNDALNRCLKQWRDRTVPEQSNYSGPILEPIDKELFVKPIADWMLRNDGKMYAGATLYDAQLTLKLLMALSLGVKFVCARVVEATWWIEIFGIGPIIEGICLGVQMSVTTLVIVRVGKEWAVLKAIETALAMAWRDLLRKGVTAGLIPVLGAYADSVAGGKGGSGRDASALSPTVLNRAAQRTLEHLHGRHRVQELGVFPSCRDLRLPVVPERPPFTKQQEGERAVELGTWRQPPSLWHGNYTYPDMENVLRTFRNLGQLGRVRDRIKYWLDWFGDQDWSGGGGWLGDAVGAFSSATGLGVTSPTDIISQLNQARDAFQLADAMSALPIPGVVYDDQGNENADLGYSSNPCLKDENYRLRRFYWEVERRSQWVRATYPYVDSFRRPIRDFLYINCRYSDAATYYIHWTNRYTLADSFLIRKGESDGQDAQKQSDEQGTLDNILERLRALRHQFDITVQGQPEDPDAGEAPGNGSFDVISSELEGIANSITSGLAERLRAQGFSIDQWMNAVNRHRGLANQMGESAEAEYDPESDLTREDFRDTASALARIELLDALLRPLGEMLSLIDGLLEMGTPHMYVMRDSAPAMKGYEPWTLDPIAAERYFTVLAHATNVQTPAFGAPRFFPKPTVAGPVCFAQAMVYNASGRDVPAGGGSPTSAPGVRQPNTCWDTLNWRFPVKAPEWGADPAGDAKGEAWSVFFGSKPADSYCQVHLNWQAKLVPVGRDRIQALNNSGPPGTIKATAARTADSAALLGH